MTPCRRRMALAVALLALPGWAACDSEQPPAAAASGSTSTHAAVAKGARQGPAYPPTRKGFSITPQLARKPRIKPLGPPGLRAIPDGDLKEWKDSPAATWLEIDQPWQPSRPRLATPYPGRSQLRRNVWQGKKDLSARIGLASYSGGISLALKVTDDVHRPALAVSALGQSDHVVLELIPRGPRGEGKLARHLVGLRLRLGTKRQLIDLVKPRHQQRRLRLIAVTGVPQGRGYRLEAKLPLTALTPLPGPVVHSMGYRVTIYDSDAPSQAAQPTLRLSGELKLSPPLQVPEAVRKRASIRICQATQSEALWGYWHGWRCTVPYVQSGLTVGRDPDRWVSSAHARVPGPPRLVWIRERLMFVNLPGQRRGVAALLDKNDTILSLFRLGVVGSLSPGNPLTRSSGAEHFKLPDGSWAVAVVHAIPATTTALGGRCGGGHQVSLSVLALRHCLTSTPHKPAPPPPRTPYIEEVLRVLLEDCTRRVANDWTLSKDRRTIRVHSSLYPTRPPVVHVYRGGRYVPAVKP